MTLNNRTVLALRADGWLAQSVEQTIPRSFIKRDLFGVIDIVAVKDGQVRFIQVTSSSNIAAHRKKINESGVLKHIREIEMWSWKKKKNRWGFTIKRAWWQMITGEFVVGVLESGSIDPND